MSVARYSVVFCESLRMESSGQETLVGVYPDNIQSSQFPLALPTLAVYCRISFDPKAPPSRISVRLADPDENNLFVNPIGGDVINAAIAGVAADRLPLATIITRAALAPFQATKPGQYRMYVDVDGKEAIGGLLNFKLAAP